MRRNSIIWILVLGLASGAGLASDAVEEAPGGELATILSWVADLSHASWTRRVAAQEALLDAGAAALRPLRDALGKVSADPEKEHRLRGLIDRIDPQLARFDFIRIGLGERPTVQRHGGVQLSPGEKGQLRLGQVTARPAQGEPRGLSSAANTYSLSWSPVSEAALELLVEPSRSSRSSPRRFLFRDAMTRVLESGEENRYLRCGLILERKSFPFLTLIRARKGRRSDFAADEPFDAAIQLDEIEDSLIAQAENLIPEDRLIAIDCLGRLRATGARSLFESALKFPGTRAAAALALAEIGEPEGTRIVAQLLEQKSESRGDLASRKLRGARILARRGDLGGLSCLLKRLLEKDLFQANEVRSALADVALVLHPEHPRRDEFLDACLGEATLGDAPWHNPNVEHFFLSAFRLLSPKVDADRQRARSTADILARVAAGKFAISSQHTSRILPIWRHVVSFGTSLGETVDEKPFYLQVLRGGSRLGIRDVSQEIQQNYSGLYLDDDLFAALIVAYERTLTGLESTYYYSYAQKLAGLSGAIRLHHGQLAAWVKLLDDWASAPVARSASQTAATQIERELSRLTGVRAPPRRARVTRTPPSKTPSPWSLWLKSLANVERREKELAEETPGSPAGTEGAVLFCAFDIRLTNSSDESPPELEILDARRIYLRPDESTSYFDRWGNRRRVRLESTPRSTSSTLTPSYRLRGWHLKLGDPSLLTGSRANIQYEWFEASDMAPRGRSTQRTSVASYKTLVHLISAEEAAYFSPEDEQAESKSLDSRPKSFSDPGSFSTEDEASLAIWKQYIEKHYRSLPENVSSTRALAYLRILSDLPISGGQDMLRLLLEKSPTTIQSRILSELFRIGDPFATEFVMKKLQGGSDLERFNSALELSRLGVQQGPVTLGELVHSKSLATSQLHQKRQALSAFATYLRKKPDDGKVRSIYLNFLMDAIDNRNLQLSAFQSLLRLTGKDFGYQAARRRPSAQRQKAIQNAINLAKLWWHDQDRPGG